MFRMNVVAIGATLLALSCVPLAHAAGGIGKVVAIVGQPSANGPAGSRSLDAGSEVFEDDKIVVVSGNAQIILNDGTRIVVGPASTLVLDRFVMRGKSKADRVAIKALRGTFRFITGRSAKSAYKITTAQATIGIRGTGFDFWTKKKTGAVVLNGRVSLAGLRGGAAIEVRSGCQMGEASLNSSRKLSQTEKVKSIRENLPYLLDQNSLRPRFRLDVTTCRLSPSDIENRGESREFDSHPERKDSSGQGGRDTSGGEDGEDDTDGEGD